MLTPKSSTDSACGTALSKYHGSVTASCAKDPQPWVGVPANYYGDLIWAQYNLTCVKDPKTKQWCNGLYSIIATQTYES